MHKRIQQEEIAISRLISMKGKKYGEYWGGGEKNKGERRKKQTIKNPPVLTIWI